MRIRTTGILGLFCALALGIPAVVSCSTAGSGGGALGGAGGLGGTGGTNGSIGNFGSTGCTKSPQDCTKCSNTCAQCMCFSTNTSQCSQLCNANGSGGSTNSGGAGGGTPGCSSGNCNQCSGCYDSCICHGGSAQNCQSACNTGNGGSGGSGYGGSGYGGSGYGGSGYGGSGYGGSGYGGSGYGGSGYGGSGGSGGGTSMLGAQCTSNTQCGTNEICATATGNTFGGGGPSRGYCTRSCTTNSDCLSGNAECVSFPSGGAYCLLGCNSAGTNQCLGRYDEVCLDLSSGDAGTGTQACIPECATDADCAGLKCDLSTGLCTSSPKTGSPVGTNCDPTASTDPCAGFCIGTSSTDPTQGMCSALCSASSVGVSGACGSNPTQGSAQDAACLFQANMNSGTTVGICGQLCNCDSDCRHSGDVCESWAAAGVSNPSQFNSTFQKAGLCVQGGADAGVTGTPTCP